MKFCGRVEVSFMHPGRVLREANVVHYGGNLRAAAWFIHALQRTWPSGSRLLSTRLVSSLLILGR